VVLRLAGVEREDPRRVFARLGIRPSKGRGQHFLVDRRVAARQMNYADVKASDVALEIGPGLGVLTAELLARARHVIVIESDRRFSEYLRRHLPEAEVIHGDALHVEWPPFDVMVSNLPYQISSPLTFKLLGTPFDRAILMYQWEFARRMIAAPGSSDYSRLSVGVYVRSNCTLLERVPRNAFHPQPRVDSALVRLEPRPSPFPIADPDLYDTVVAALFEHRRKTLENGLRLAWRKFAESAEAFEKILATVPFRGRRVEELRPEEIARIADAIRTAKG
jgi:16S rRNA (adenine1518-N6/adenine1519-N6)-dimethyltransferase